MFFFAAVCAEAGWGAAVLLVAGCDAVVGGTVFFATAWVVVWDVLTAGGDTGFCVAFEVALSAAYKPLAVRQSPVNRRIPSLQVL